LSANGEAGGTPGGGRPVAAAGAAAGAGAEAEAEERAAAAAAAAADATLTFRQAMAELEDILQRIEGEEIDIDQLAQELRRAAQLLDLCRGKIRKAEVEVTQIVQSLEESGQDEDRDRS
jgi:exodeoxyribonuclease VII small subunit